jgi:hypothetical protein
MSLIEILDPTHVFLDFVKVFRHLIFRNSKRRLQYHSFLYNSLAMVYGPPITTSPVGSYLLHKASAADQAVTLGKYPSFRIGIRAGLVEKINGERMLKLLGSPGEYIRAWKAGRRNEVYGHQE